MKKMKNILFGIYYITLMPYFERDKYFQILCNEMDDYTNKIVSNENRMV